MNTFLSGPIARYLRDQGRFGDTELAHVNPEEAALLRSRGGSGTINPSTGLREFSDDDDDDDGNWLSDTWDAVTDWTSNTFGDGTPEGVSTGSSSYDENKARDVFNQVSQAQQNGITYDPATGRATIGDQEVNYDPVTQTITTNEGVTIPASQASSAVASSGSSGGTTTTTTSTPAAPDYTTSEGFKSLLFDLFKSGVLDKPYKSYGGNRFAGFNTDQTQAFTDTRAFSDSSNQAINDAITAASGETGYG